MAISPKDWDKPYTHQPYPAVRYAPKKPLRPGDDPYETRIVHNPDEEGRLGAGWYDSPGAFPESERFTAEAPVPATSIESENEALKIRIAEIENEQLRAKLVELEGDKKPKGKDK
jgi:hypothetical protein